MNANAPKYQSSNGKLSAVTPIPLTDFLAMLEKSNSGIVQNPTIVLSDRLHSNPIMGEKRAGTVVDIRSGVVYDVMVMPGELENVTWAEAKASITAAGGDLPTPVEMLMLNGLLGRVAFQDSYWVDEKVKFDGDAEDSISYFSDGIFDFSDAEDRMSARGVRRVCIGDAADENLDEVDDNTVIVPAPNAELEIAQDPISGEMEIMPASLAGLHAELLQKGDRLSIEAASEIRRLRRELFQRDVRVGIMGDTVSTTGPDLSDRPDLQQMRADLLTPVPPLTGQKIVSVLDELNGIKDADDDAQLAADVCTRVIDVINGLMLIVDPEQIK
jgi:hypothetical protein